MDKEVRVFKKFAKVCPYPIDFDSIEKREPPEPDIFCKFRDGSPIAFEMSECIDEGIARSIFDPLDLKRALDTELEKLPNKKKQRIKTNFSDAVISVAFGKGISKDKKRSSIKTIFDYLLTLKNRADGEFDLKLQPSLKGIIRRISIKRGFDSLSFDIEPEAIWFSNPVVERIKTKFFDKTYKPKCNRIELLCYYELQPELPKNRWVPAVENFVKSNLKSSMFERIWIYSFIQDKIIYVYPDLQKTKEIQKRIDYDLKKEGLQKKMPNKLMNPMLSSKEKQFHSAMIDIYRRAKLECNFNANRFLQMVSNHGGFEAAKRLLRSGDLVQSGFITLWECGCLHLSMEALVLRPEFRQLFTEEELMIAENRLREHDYEMQEYTKSLDINSAANNDNKGI